MKSRSIAACAALSASITTGALGLAPVTSADQTTAPACRNYSAAETRVNSSGGGASQVCDFNTATNEHTCTLNLSQPGGARRIVSVRKYASAADFVDEVRVIPALSYALSGSTTYSPSGPGARNSKLAFAYDSQHRLTSITFQFADGTSVRTNFTAWDPAGRPTTAANGGQTFSYSYDDVARTHLIVNTTSGGVQTHVFDPNGNEIREVSTPRGGTPTTTTMTITRTARVCR